MKASLRKIRMRRKILRIYRPRRRVFDYLFDAMFEKAWRDLADKS